MMRTDHQEADTQRRSCHDTHWPFKNGITDLAPINQHLASPKETQAVPPPQSDTPPDQSQRCQGPMVQNVAHNPAQPRNGRCGPVSEKESRSSPKTHLHLQGQGREGALLSGGDAWALTGPLQGDTTSEGNGAKWIQESSQEPFPQLPTATPMESCQTSSE
ncbi:hypothetical protein MDA_GLEAN10003242 [Myotis davidii]|uniref:Uncharacterized protein n=1 Tax=Myotis davidii TaxID=225400 RepID=L5LW30_MYODS|nr:hypothetical protein MDA_GLEAN10003242 [Myotis davidii]